MVGSIALTSLQPWVSGKIGTLCPYTLSICPCLGRPGVDCPYPFSEEHTPGPSSNNLYVLFWERNPGW